MFFRKKKETSRPPNEKNFGKGSKGFKGTGKDSKLGNYEETIKNLSTKTNELTKSLEKMKFDTGKLGDLDSMKKGI